HGTPRYLPAPTFFNSVLLGVIHQKVHSHGEPILRSRIVSNLTIDTLQPAIKHYPFDVRVVDERSKRGLLGTALQGNLMIVRYSSARSFLLPVGIVKRISVCIEECGIVRRENRVLIRIVLRRIGNTPFHYT